jgi:hypothetical protein
MVVRSSVRLEGEPAVFFIAIDTREVLRQSASPMSRPGDIPLEVVDVYVVPDDIPNRCSSEDLPRRHAGAGYGSS